jgi:hypothetical protein
MTFMAFSVTRNELLNQFELLVWKYLVPIIFSTLISGDPLQNILEVLLVLLNSDSTNVGLPLVAPLIPLGGLTNHEYCFGWFKVKILSRQ